jgi:hypothetical protein
MLWKKVECEKRDGPGGCCVERETSESNKKELKGIRTVSKMYV